MGKKLRNKHWHKRRDAFVKSFGATPEVWLYEHTINGHVALGIGEHVKDVIEARQLCYPDGHPRHPFNPTPGVWFVAVASSPEGDES
jgi:hypothetical protein